MLGAAYVRECYANIVDLGLRLLILANGTAARRKCEFTSHILPTITTTKLPPPATPVRVCDWRSGNPPLQNTPNDSRPQSRASPQSCSPIVRDPSAEVVFKRKHILDLPRLQYYTPAFRPPRYLEKYILCCAWRCFRRLSRVLIRTQLPAPYYSFVFTFVYGILHTPACDPHVF